MADQDRAGWTKVVADFETSDLSQREFAKARRGGQLANCCPVNAGGVRTAGSNLCYSSCDSRRLPSLPHSWGDAGARGR
jgi:hypothetical protein